MQRLIPSVPELKSSEKQEIHESKSIQDVLNYLSDQHILFVFDLDNTVMQPVDVDDLGSDQWFAKLIDEARKMIADRSDAMHVAVTIRNAVHKQIKMQAVQPEVVSIIHFLQSKNIPVLALTARGSSIIDTTEKQLKSIDVDFSKQWEKLAKTAHYQNGIIYCDGADKGTFLASFLKDTGYLFYKIIMTDDSEKNLLNTQKAITASGGSFTGLRYGYLDNQVAQFDMKKARDQLFKLKNNFSSDEKEALKKLNNSVTQFSLYRPVKEKMTILVNQKFEQCQVSQP